MNIKNIKISTIILMVMQFEVLFNTYGWTLFIHVWPIAFCFIVCSIIEKRKIVFDYKYMLMTALILIYVLLAYLCGDKYDVSKKYTLYRAFELLVVCIVLMNEVSTDEIKLVMVGSELSACLVFIKMIIQRVTLDNDKMRFTISNSGYKMDSNFLATIFILPLIYSFFKVIKEKKISNVLLLLISLIGIILTGSRGTLLSVVLTCGVAYIIDNKDTRHFVCLSIIVALLLIFIVSFLPDGILSRFSIDNLNDSSNAFRIRLWETSWKVFLSNPLFGRGAGCIYALAGQYGGVKGMSQHNFVLEILTDYGLVGFALYFALFVRCFYRQLKKDSFFGVCVLIATFVAAFFIPGLDSFCLWYNLCLMLMLDRIMYSSNTIPNFDYTCDRT